jgi:hypothetical protein
MSSLRDEGIEVVPVIGGFRYNLPLRAGKPVKIAGLAIGIFGVVVTTFMLFWMSGPLQGFFRDPGVTRWISLAFGLFGLGGLIPGLAMLLGGLGAAAGWSRCAVEVAGLELKLIERCGLLRWTWARNLADLRELCLMYNTGFAGVADGETPRSPMPGFGAMTAMSYNPKKTIHIGLGYPDSVLWALGAELSERTKLPLKRDTLAADEKTDETAGDRPRVAAEQAADRLAAERPPKTDIVIQQLANGIGLSVPPAGLVRGSKGLFVFAIIWLAFCALIFGVMGVAAMKGDPKGDAPPMAVFAFAAVFIAIGVGMLIGAINMGTRRALIAVTGGALTIRRIGLRKTREWRFDRGEVAAVRMGRSGMEVNDKPVMELQIVCKDGKKVGFLSQRNEGELLWIAAGLRQALDVRAEPPARP